MRNVLVNVISRAAVALFVFFLIGGLARSQSQDWPSEVQKKVDAIIKKIGPGTNLELQIRLLQMEAEDQAIQRKYFDPPTDKQREIALSMDATDQKLKPIPPSGSARPEIVPYVQYLEGIKQTSVEYVISLFDSFDVVILGERNHKDITQYEFILNLVEHPKFVERIGHVFTEIGSQSQQPRVEAFLRTSNLSSDDLEEKLLDIYRYLSRDGYWDKTNLFTFLRQVYQFNQTLPERKKVIVHPSDISFDWEKGTADSYRIFDQTILGRRDYYMAQNVLSGIKEIAKTDPTRRKALVIMNYRHSFNRDISTPREEIENTGRFLFEAIPGKVANVLINTVDSFTDHLARNGRWDAAFSVLKKWDAGFSFSNSPFGKDPFDLWGYPNTLSYQDVYTGFVFYLPLDKHRLVTGIPGILNETYRKELKRRWAILGEPYNAETELAIEKELGTVSETPYPKLDLYLKNINQWIKK
jgi:hypothetical protein